MQEGLRYGQGKYTWEDKKLGGTFDGEYSEHKKTGTATSVIRVGFGVVTVFLPGLGKCVYKQRPRRKEPEIVSKYEGKAECTLSVRPDLCSTLTWCRR